MGSRISKNSVSIAVVIAFILCAISLGMPLIMAAFSAQDATFSPSRSSVTSLPPGRYNSGSELAKGTFLVANRHLKDPHFSKTVILLIKYDRTGALGLIINQPTDVKLSTVFPEIESLQKLTDTVYIGGPVARGNLFILLQSGSQPEKSQKVFDDIYVSSSKKVITEIIDNAGGGKKFRVYAGLASWVAGQLDWEVSRGSWNVVQADAENIFSKQPSGIWPGLILQSSTLHVSL